MSLIKLLELPSLCDSRGGMVALESNRNVPFDIKRAYYIFNTSRGVSRGYHAHKELKQLAICLSGTCRFILDDGNKRESVLLDSPFEGLFIESFMWREMHEFSSDCVLLVLASEYYDESDYIRSYEQFIEFKK